MLTLWTIRISLLCYAATIALLCAGWLRTPRWKTLRMLWTAGAVSFVAHVLAAFQFNYDWSHATAVAHTAVRTREVVGVAVGEGLYFSYLFLIVWVADVAWWWFDSERYRGRSPRIAWFIHCYLIFIALNGTVIFETGKIRWGGIVAIIGWCVVATYQRLLPSFFEKNDRQPTAPNAQT